MFSEEFVRAVKFCTISSLFVGVWQFASRFSAYEEMVREFLRLAFPLALLFGFVVWWASKIPVDYPEDYWKDGK